MFMARCSRLLATDVRSVAIRGANGPSAGNPSPAVRSVRRSGSSGYRTCSKAVSGDYGARTAEEEREERGRRMTAARRPDEFAGPCRVNTLPPLYPHCMRHQQHRCLYSNPPPPPPPPPLCSRPPHLPTACSDGHLETHLLQRRHSERRPPSVPHPPKHAPNDGLLVLKVVSSASAEPDKKTQYEIVSVNVRHGRFRKAVPCMPLALSILLCVVNMLAPGVGTFLAALTVLCGCQTEYEDRCTAFLYNVLASFLQMLTALIVIGWVWSIMWGITFVSISITKKEHEIVAATL